MSDQEPTQQPADFEAILAELATLVDRMEQGDISLEESMAAFERGVSLTRQAQQTLAQAEQKVKLLLEQDGEPVLETFTEPEDEG